VTNTTKGPAKFGFKASHPYEMQVVNPEKCDLDARRSTKVLLRF